MTRKRRYLISAAVLAACVCIAIGVLAMLPPRPGVTKANFDRIENGMKLADVATIFGMPPQVESDRLGVLYCAWFGRTKSGATIGAEIYFRDGEAYYMEWFAVNETIPDKLCRWLHLPNAAVAPVPGGIPPPQNFP